MTARTCEIAETGWGFAVCARHAPFCVSAQPDLPGVPLLARLFSCSRHLPASVGVMQESDPDRRAVLVHWQEDGFPPDASEKPVKERFDDLAESRAARVEAAQDVPAVPQAASAPVRKARR